MAKPTALHSWWNSDLDARPHSVLSYSIAVFPKVKYRENGAGSWAKPYIQDINCCCHPRRGEGSVDLSSHIRIISQLLQTRKWNGCIHLERCEQLQSWMSGVAPHNAYMWAWTHSRVCPTRYHARLQKLWRTSAVCGETECSSCICATDKPAFAREQGDLYSADAVYSQGCTNLSLIHTHTGTFMYIDTAHGTHTNKGFFSLCTGHCSHQVQSVLLRSWTLE